MAAGRATRYSTILDLLTDRRRRQKDSVIRRQKLKTLASKSAMIGFRRVSGMAASISERPMCPVCKHRMALVRISPGQRGFEERTFECSTCERTEVASFEVDPMKTDAVGWLAGELKPPQ
jgi:hypothetical protein